MELLMRSDLNRNQNPEKMVYTLKMSNQEIFKPVSPIIL
jgi:hypothetical protein